MKKLAKIAAFLLTIGLLMPAGKVNAASTSTIDYNNIRSLSTYFEAGDTVTFREDTTVTFQYSTGGGRFDIERDHTGKNPYTIESYTDSTSKEHKYWRVEYKGDINGKNVIQMASVTSLPITATLDKAGLLGADASLDKTVITLPDDSLTVTITPNEATVFNNPPTVSASVGNPGAVTLQENGAYTCTISNVTARTAITVIGETVAVPVIALKDVTITGKKDEVLAAQNIAFDLKNKPFKAPMQGSKVTEWLNLPAGLDATVTEHSDTSLVLKITGTPTEKSSEAISVTVPADQMSSGKAYTVKTNTKAKFDIKDKDTPSTPENSTSASTTPDKNAPGGTGLSTAPDISGKSTIAPRTGDESAIMISAAAMMLAAVTGIVVLKRKKYGRKTN